MNENKLSELEHSSIGKLLWKYSLPAVVGNIVMSTYNVIDRIFIGQGVGADAIAGLAITFPLMNISAALGTLIGVGAAARISIVLGEKNHRLAEQILGNSLVLTILIALSYSLCFGLFLEDILRLFGASDTTLPYAYDYLWHLLPGFVLINLCYSFNNMMRASGYPGKAMVTMMIGAVINVVLDPIFIFVFDMGIKGAALATVIAMGISAAFVMWHFVQPTSILHFKRGIYRLKWHLIATICSIGAAPFVVNIAGSFINGILNNSLYRHGGDSAVGAAGIMFTYTQLLVMLIIGVCQGMQPIVGYNYGAQRFHRLRRAFWLACAVASAICIIGAAPGVFFTRVIAVAFTTDPKLIEETCHGMSMSMLAFWFVGFQIVSTNFFQSIGKAGKSIFLSLTRQVLFLIPLLMLLPRFLTLDGVWLSFPASDLCATVTTAILIMREFNDLRRRSHTMLER